MVSEWCQQVPFQKLGAQPPASLAHLSVQKILSDDRHDQRGYLDDRLDALRSSHQTPPLTSNPLRIAPTEDIAGNQVVRI